MKTSDAPRVSVLSVAYQSRDYIVRCLQSVVAHTRVMPYEILLIDNGTDNSAALVMDALPQVRIVPSRGNIGFGAANNELARHARSDLLLLLNPDTELELDAIDRLVAFADAMPGAAAWAGQMVDATGRLDSGNWMRFPTLRALATSTLGLRRAGGVPLAPEAPDQPYQAPILCGGFMLIHRDAFEALGGFDESFFLYSEEVDLFARLAASGREAWVTPASRIVHDVGSGAVLSPQRILFKTKGQMHFLHKHWPAPKVLMGGALIWAQAAQRAVRGKMLGWLVPRWRGMAAAYGPIALRPGTWMHGYRAKGVSSTMDGGGAAAYEDVSDGRLQRTSTQA